MISLAKYIKINLFLIIYIVSTVFTTYCQQKKPLVYVNNNRWSVFIFDFKNNRYCYRFAHDFLVNHSVYSKGQIIKKGDTVIVISDYDNMKLPCNFKCLKNNEQKENKIIFHFTLVKGIRNHDMIISFIRKKLLYFIVNDEDTFKLDKDTITYLNKIHNFYLASWSEDRIIYYKTKTYINTDNYNNFEVSFCINPSYTFYKSLNDTIIFNKSKATWHLSNEKAYVNLKKTSLKKVQRVIDDCECWDKQGTINLDVDTPFCSKPK